MTLRSFSPEGLGPRSRGILVLAVQLALVLSIAAKYAWERHTCPMVWTRTTQFDPEQPLRGRYLALTLTVDACGLAQADAEKTFTFSAQGGSHHLTSQTWTAELKTQNGGLVALRNDPSKLKEVQHVILPAERPCQMAMLGSQTEFFIAEHAKSPFPLAKGKELWALVTVPPQGPPRPVQLAISDGKSFRPLDLR